MSETVYTKKLVDTSKFSVIGSVVKQDDDDVELNIKIDGTGLKGEISYVPIESLEALADDGTDKRTKAEVLVGLLDRAQALVGEKDTILKAVLGLALPKAKKRVEEAG